MGQVVKSSTTGRPSGPSDWFIYRVKPVEKSGIIKRATIRRFAKCRTNQQPGKSALISAFDAQDFADRLEERRGENTVSMAAGRIPRIQFRWWTKLLEHGDEWHSANAGTIPRPDSHNWTNFGEEWAFLGASSRFITFRINRLVFTRVASQSIAGVLG